MNSVFIKGLILLFVALWFSNANAAEPYVQLGAGILARDVISEGEEQEFLKFRGEAVSTRLLAKLGIELWEILDLYVQGGGADLSIDEFADYDGGLSGAFGGGLRFNLYRSSYRDQFTLYVEGNALRYTTDDQVRVEVDCTGISGCPSSPDNFLPRPADEEIQWNEYTILFGASGRYAGFSPYGGIRLSMVDATDRIRAAVVPPSEDFPEGLPDFQTKLDLEEDDNFGMFFGLDIFLDRSEKTALNFEVSIIDQDSFRAAIRREF